MTSETWKMLNGRPYHRTLLDKELKQRPFVYQQDYRNDPTFGKWFWYTPGIPDSDVGPFDTKDAAAQAMKEAERN